MVRFSLTFFDRKRTTLFEYNSVVVTSHPLIVPAPFGIGTTELKKDMLTGPIVAYVIQGVTLGLPYEHAYGHRLRDSIIPLLLIPKKCLDNSVIICSNHYVEFLQELLPVMGFNYPDKILVLDFNEAAYAEKLYKIADKNGLFSVAGIKTIRNFVTIVKSYLNITHMKSTVYMLCNRPKDSPRHICKFDEFVLAIRKAYPKHNWTVVLNHVPTVLGQARQWSAVRMVVGPCGSNFFNVIFMNPNGVMVYFRSPTYADVGNNGAAVVANVWVLSVPYHGWEGKHFVADENHTPMNIRLGVEYVGYGLYVLKNQKWPEKFSISRVQIPLGTKYTSGKLKKEEIANYSFKYWPELFKDPDYVKLYGPLPNYTDFKNND